MTWVLIWGMCFYYTIEVCIYTYFIKILAINGYMFLLNAFSISMEKIVGFLIVNKTYLILCILFCNVSGFYLLTGTWILIQLFISEIKMCIYFNFFWFVFVMVIIIIATTTTMAYISYTLYTKHSKSIRCISSGPPCVKSWLIGKDSDARRNWGQEEKGTTEDEMAGWHHRLDGHEFG